MGPAVAIGQARIGQSEDRRRMPDRIDLSLRDSPGEGRSTL
jgi:hypothetical protein